MADSDPKLRVLDDDDDGDNAEVVRLKGRGAVTPPDRPPVRVQPVEKPERLEAEVREGKSGPSLEPGVEAILEQDDAEETVEQPWGMASRKVAGIPHGWFWVIGLVILGCAFWSVKSMREGEKEVDLQHVTIQAKVDDDVEATQIARNLVDRVEEVAAEYLKAESVDDVMPWVRHPDRVKPLIEAELRERPKQSLEFVRMAAFQPATLDGRPFWLVRAEVRDGEPVDLLLEQTDEAEVKVDWETDVCHQPMDWDRYVTGRPSERSLDFRVWAVPDSHYSHEFSDSGRWRCFRLTAKGSAAPLFGYALAGSEVEKELSGYCRGVPNQIASAILRLRVPAGTTAPKGVVIERLVERRWQYVDNPGENSP